MCFLQRWFFLKFNFDFTEKFLFSTEQWFCLGSVHINLYPAELPRCLMGVIVYASYLQSLLWVGFPQTTSPIMHQSFPIGWATAGHHGRCSPTQDLSTQKGAEGPQTTTPIRSHRCCSRLDQAETKCSDLVWQTKLLCYVNDERNWFDQMWKPDIFTHFWNWMQSKKFIYFHFLSWLMIDTNVKISEFPISILI